MMNYKGYVGRVEYDDVVGVFYGEVINLADVVTFQGTTVEELRRAFQESMDDYLESCAQRGEEPDRPSTVVAVCRSWDRSPRFISIMLSQLRPVARRMPTI